MIVNEYALVVGVVTLKDVMSIVMGELVATEEEPQIIRRDEASWLIEGAAPLEDVMRALDIVDFPHSENYETIGGFMMYSLRKIPKKTDFVLFDRYKFEIIDTENLKIDQLLVSFKQAHDKPHGSPHDSATPQLTLGTAPVSVQQRDVGKSGQA